MHRAQKVVNDVQIRELAEIVEWLDAVLDDKQKRYYLLIDRLDENWVEDGLRYRLIRALIETVRDFRKVRNAKVIIALRQDVLERVFRLTQNTGFQEEKYESLYLPLRWSREQLIEITDRRVDHLVRSRYTKERVAHADLLPKAVGRVPAIDYMIDRTLMRPRDIIQFFNYCIAQAVDTAKITVAMLKDAEGQYSRSRLRSLQQEWAADYPNLLRFTDILKARNHVFDLLSLSDEECAEFCLEAVAQGFEDHDLLSDVAQQVVDCVAESSDLRRLLVHVFYRVGLVGLKDRELREDRVVH